jgi:sulfatase maturation enzyme AslB (radical SAM superfamily)
MRKPFCVVPFVEAFSGMDSNYRNCCAAYPQISSLPGQTFEQWQQDPRLIEFRKSLSQDQWISECRACEIQEKQHGQSFRTAVNSTVEVDDVFGKWPSRWNLKFGNVCNLACWSCGEQSSSVIAHHKRQINILPNGFVDPEKEFQRLWPQLKANVLKSYDYHKTVTLTLLGGEPLVNKTVLTFLDALVELGLASRTRLEFHTNATLINEKLFAIGQWQYVCVFLSLDAVGHKAEWLRYGCDWNQIETNVEFFKSVSDYVEVHCTLGVLNIKDLPELAEFCSAKKLPLKVTTLSSPEFMSLFTWPASPDLIANRTQLEKFGYDQYYDMIGNASRSDMPAKLLQYIQQFDNIRQNLMDFDPDLLLALKVSAH